MSSVSAKKRSSSVTVCGASSEMSAPASISARESGPIAASSAANSRWSRTRRTVVMPCESSHTAWARSSSEVRRR